jgi:hypothetical protein
MTTPLIKSTIILLLACPVSVKAQETPSKVPEQAAGPETTVKTKIGGVDKLESQVSELVIVGKGEHEDNFDFTRGDSLKIKATGANAQSLHEELKKVPVSSAVVLYLDGVRMANLPVTVSEARAGGALQLSFSLVRNPSDDENRKSWDMFLEKQKSYEMKPTVALAVGNAIPWDVQRPNSFTFRIAKTTTIFLIFLVGLLIFMAVFYLLVKNPAALRDSKDGFYSLGKSQMAFWGLLVVLTFVGVLFVTGTMERIPAQVLILLGISGATGLGAVVIGENKKTIRESENQATITKLREEQEKLEKEQLTASATFPQVSKDRLAAIKLNLGALSNQAQLVETGQFWRDILDDGNGLSFHRLQVVIWTVVLGSIFVWSVAQVMSMPEFPETLLVLMGISNGTYLGFKLPEKA